MEFLLNMGKIICSDTISYCKKSHKIFDDSLILNLFIMTLQKNLFLLTSFTILYELLRYLPFQILKLDIFIKYFFDLILINLSKIWVI